MGFVMLQLSIFLPSPRHQDCAALLLSKQGTYLTQVSSYSTGVGAALAGHQTPSKASLLLILSWTGVRKYEKRLVG